MSLSNLPLADAALVDITFHWQSARCTCTFYPDELEMHVLVFTGVSELHVPCRLPLGPSSVLGDVREHGQGLFELELLSGDVIKVAATNWEFRKERRAATRA